MSAALIYVFVSSYVFRLLIDHITSYILSVQLFRPDI